MVDINLLDEDRLGKPPEGESQPQESAEQPQQEQLEDADTGEDQQESEETGVRIPRAKERTSDQPPKKRKVQKSPVGKGPSTGFIIFLLVVAIAVTGYYLFIREPREMTPVPVQPDTTAGQMAEVPTEAEPVEQPITGDADDQAQRATVAVTTEASATAQARIPEFGTIERNRQDIVHSVMHGVHKLESCYRLLNNINDQSRLGFLSISNDHLVLSAGTNSRTFALRVRTQITNTSIIENIVLFDISNRAVYAQGTTAVDIYANLKKLEELSENNRLRDMSIGAVHRQLKEWIAIPSVELVTWQTKQVQLVDTWRRGPLFIEIDGSKTGIVRVIHALKNYGYNLGISKVYVFSRSNEVGDHSQFTLKLYVNLFGKDIS